MSLKQNVISGVKWTSLSTIITTIIQLLQLSILTSFLEPDAFGLMALVMVIVGFSQAFSDMGISNAIIHKQDISHEQLSTLYWVNVIAGVILFLILIAVAPLVAKFYNESQLVNLIFIVALTFVIQPFGHQFSTLWQKNMRFYEVAIIDMVMKSFSLIISVCLAYKGFGVFALVYGTLGGVIIQTILYLYIGLKEYKPSFTFRLENIKEFLNFGLYQMGEKTLNYLNIQIDTILIGKFLGVEALGIYFVAKQIIMRVFQLFNPIIARVAFPTMAKIQNDINKLKNVYLKIINYSLSIIFPIYAFIFIFSNEIVNILFGEKYLESVYIMQILSIWGIFKSISNPVSFLLFAKGKANWSFWWNILLFFYMPIGIYIGNYWGLIGISWALVVLQIFLIIPAWYFLVKRLCNASFFEYHKEISIPLSLSFVGGIVSYFVVINIEELTLKIICGSIVGLMLIIFLNYSFNRSFLIDLKKFKK